MGNHSLSSLTHAKCSATVTAVTATPINHVSFHADDLDESGQARHQILGIQLIASATF
jgi:hypothetical protein